MLLKLRLRIIYCNPEDGVHNKEVRTEVNINDIHAFHGFGKFTINNAGLFSFRQATDEISCFPCSVL